jgi:hypothetical protein
MTKTYGARLFCHVCHAEPWPDSPEIRESFDLRRIDGALCCELHRPKRVSKQHAPCAAATLVVDALTAFEAVLAEQEASLAESISDDDGAVAALDDFHEEVTRSLAELRKATCS